MQLFQLHVAEHQALGQLGHLFRQHQLLRLQRLPLRLLRLARRLCGGQAPRQRRRGSAQAPLLRRSAARQGRARRCRRSSSASTSAQSSVCS